MLSWTIIFLVIALVAAVFGFWGLAGTAAWIAKVLFVIFLVIFVLSLLLGRTAAAAESIKDDRVPIVVHCGDTPCASITVC